VQTHQKEGGGGKYVQPLVPEKRKHRTRLFLLEWKKRNQKAQQGLRGDYVFKEKESKQNQEPCVTSLRFGQGMGKGPREQE